LNMMLGRWRLWFWVGLLLIVAVTAASVAFIRYDSGAQGLAGVLVQVLVMVATAAASAAAWLWTRARPAKVARLTLDRAADELAEELCRQWKRVADERGLTQLATIPVRWRWSRRQVTGPMADAVSGFGGVRFASLPGMAPVTVEQLHSGTLKDLLGVYGGVRSGRLIILGEPGAGKSAAGIRLLRDALDHRFTVAAEDQMRVPVPVLVSPQSWNPTVEPFTEWLATWLARDYALLRAPEYGGDAAIRLVEGGHLAVILDGLDEMPQVLRSAALRALDEQATFRLVVLTRREELVAAVSGGHLRGAAALELLPINPRQAAEYLANSQIDPLPRSWQNLIEHLHKHPSDVLALTLGTPLTLTLIRDTYGPGEQVDELIDSNCFTSREAIENHLLDRVLTAAYTRRPDRSVSPYTIDQARCWLGHLARRMNEEGTRDLAWWRISHWVPAWPRVVTTVAILSVVAALFIGALAQFATHVTLPSAFEIRFQQLTLVGVFGKALGNAFLLGAGLLFLSRYNEESPSRSGRPRWSRTDIFTIFFLALGVGVGFGLEVGYVAGVVCSFIVGLGFILSGGPPQRLCWLRWGRTDTRTNLLTGLVIGLVAGLVAGLGYGFLHGMRFGLVYGFIVGIGYMLVIVIGGRPSQRRDHFWWSRIDTPTTLLIGLVIAIVSSGSNGIIYVFVVILSGRSPLQRNMLRWSRTTPRTLLIGLTVGLVLGVWHGITWAREYRLGPEPGLALGLVFGLTVGLLLGLRQPSTVAATSPLDPRSTWRRERLFGLVFGPVFGIVSGLTGGFVNGLVAGSGVGLVSGLMGGLVIGLGSGLVSSATWTALLASAQLRRRGEAPARLLRFLDDARDRQVLRTVGPVYQFRHARLQERLGNACQAMSGTSSDTHADHSSLSA
jgi:hypothetical protein